MISRLSEAFSVSGNEKNIKNIILSLINNDIFNISCDKIGNVIAKHTYTEGAPSVLLIAHMDECGIIISEVCDDGYLKFDLIGDIDVSALVSKRVKSEKINGVISLKAVHLSRKDDKAKSIKTTDLYVDIGAKTKDEASQYVTVGDYFTFSNDFKKLGNNNIVGKALSRSVSTYTLINFINNYKGGKANIICIFTALKETGGRGVKTALKSLENIKYAFVLDSVSENENDIQLNKGPVIGMSNESSCEERNITKKICDLNTSVQYEHIKDKSNIDVLFKDIPTIMLGFPCKNKNSNVNIVSLDDIKDLEMLLNSIISEVI